MRDSQLPLGSLEGQLALLRDSKLPLGSLDEYLRDSKLPLDLMRDSKLG